MDLKLSSCKFLLTLIAILAFSSSTSLGRIKPTQQQFDAKEDGSNAIFSQENKFKLPFVVLMSSHEICVAQLPLIGDGNVSVVYRLAEIDYVGTESADDVSPKLADAREVEQMPKFSSSLGKSSEGQQIAAKEHYSGHDREEVGRGNGDVPEARAEKSGQIEGGKRTLPRRRRRSSSSSDRSANSDADSAGNSSSTSRDGTVNNDRDASTSADRESSSAMNVTSARLGNEQEEVVRRGRMEDDEPKNGAVQFSDFDVHMRLGFAFVADTRGRIHRFKLSGFGDSLAENDYTNSIGIGARFDDFSAELASPPKLQPGNTLSDVVPASDVGSALGLYNSSTHDDADDGLSPTNSDYANKVGVNFGRHPTTSGAEQSRKLGFSASGNDGSPTYAVHSVTGSSTPEANYDVSILILMQSIV